MEKKKLDSFFFFATLCVKWQSGQNKMPFAVSYRPARRIKMKKGFTLIELLVVVLIIGILSAVALPQYTKAVMKSRYANLKTLVHSVAQGAEVYYMANGEYPTRIDELDIEIGGSEVIDGTATHRYFDWGYCSLYNNEHGDRFVCKNSLAGMGYMVVFKNSSYRPGARECVAKNTDLSSHQNQICKQETQDPSPREKEDYYEWYYENSPHW